MATNSESKVKVTDSKIKCTVCQEPVKGHTGPHGPGKCNHWAYKPTLEDTLANLQAQLHTLTMVVKEQGGVQVDPKAVERHRQSLAQAMGLAGRGGVPGVTNTDPNLSEYGEGYSPSTEILPPLVTADDAGSTAAAAAEPTGTNDEEGGGGEQPELEPEKEPEEEKIKPEPRWGPVKPPPLLPPEKDDKTKDKAKKDEIEQKQPVVASSRASPLMPVKVRLNDMPAFKGYEAIKAFNTPVELRPPAHLALIDLPNEPKPEDYGNIPELGVEECSHSIINYYAEKKCCRLKNKLKDLEINTLRPTIALHYILETFIESRTVAWKFQPYVGQPIDDNRHEQPPEPWDVPCQPEDMFKAEIRRMEVPHSNVVKPCHNCDALGYVKCHRCTGNGLVTCYKCEGRTELVREYYKGEEKLYHHTKCVCCDGTGQKYCNTCDGVETLTCQTCSGYKLLRCYLQLCVKFEVHVDDHILEAAGTDMPEHLVRDVNADVIFSQQMRAVTAINTFPVQEIADASARLVNRHRVYYRTRKSVQQRQTLRGVPVSEVEATMKDKKNKYWVYGTEGVVYCEECRRPWCICSS